MNCYYCTKNIGMIGSRRIRGAALAFPSSNIMSSGCRRRGRRMFSSSNTRSQTSFTANPFLWYSSKLETHPMTTKCLTSGFLSAAGDLLCQYLVHANNNNNNNLITTTPKNDDNSDDDNNGDIVMTTKTKNGFQPDYIRTSRFAFIGAAFVAPIIHYWYGFLVTTLAPGNSTTLWNVAKRLTYDQFLFAPIFLPSVMVNLMILEGRSFTTTTTTTTQDSTTTNNTDNDQLLIWSKLKKDYPDAILANWLLWIPSMIINFAFVPYKFMVLYSNVIAFVWNMYLSWKTQDS